MAHMSLKTVTVPSVFSAIFEQAETIVGDFFKSTRHSPESGTIEICDSRYILLRGASLSIEFFQLVRKIYGEDAHAEADLFASALLYDLAHAIGKSDARNFHEKMHLQDPIEKLSAGPVHFSHSGWASVDIDPDSNPSPDEHFVLHYSHPFSFEADAWLSNGNSADFPVCIMNAGYSSGWCEESFGLPLEAREITCRAEGHDQCRFIMAPPEQLATHIKQYLQDHPELVVRYPAVQHPSFLSDQQHNDTPHRGAEEIHFRKGMEERLLTYARKLEATQATLKRKVAQLEHEVSERQIAEHELKRLVSQDDLTGLMNRNFFMTRLETSLHAIERHHGHGRYALLFVDLDNFKHINDSLGHDIGDQLLVGVAQKLRGNVEIQDTVARLGGDEFALWIEDMPGDHVAGIIATRLIKALGQPLYIDNHEIRITPSIGIALYPDNGKTPGILLRNADLAMYHAKSAGRNNFQYFTSAMNRRVLERMSLERELRRALEQNEIEAFYQLRMRTSDRRPIGMEVLARWPHPDNGMIPPSAFIPLAEETGLIETLGRIILDKAGRQFRQWCDAGLDPGRLSINLSPRQFRQKTLVDQILQSASRSGLPLDRLELEITESAIMDDIASAIAIMNELKSHGITLSIDDFGTGYSSLSHLQHFPVDILKIDRSFIRDLNGPDCQQARLVESIIRLGHSLNLGVVAEGVETEAQFSIVRELGCEEAQGYHLSHPVPAEKINSLLREYLQSATIPSPAT